MNKTALVIMAAGLGSRFGGGIKQLAPVGLNGEIIMDYSIYDALEAGFNKVVFVIRRDLEKDFKEIIGKRIEKVVEVEYAYQELSDIPAQFYGKLEERKKPWGTGQAILCCKDVVQEPFLVINADDYYGKEAYQVAYQYLSGKNTKDALDICMVGFVLENTLSEHGAVTRGVCKIDENHMLTDIEETFDILKKGEAAVGRVDEQEYSLPLHTPVSMNMWGLHPKFFRVLEQGFREFLKDLEPEEIKKEYLLPKVIGDLIRKENAQVKVLESKDQWFGVTYQEDKEYVVQSIRDLIEKGVYPEKLFL